MNFSYPNHEIPTLIREGWPFLLFTFTAHHLIYMTTWHLRGNILFIVRLTFTFEPYFFINIGLLFMPRLQTQRFLSGGAKCSATHLQKIKHKHTHRFVYTHDSEGFQIQYRSLFFLLYKKNKEDWEKRNWTAEEGNECVMCVCVLGDGVVTQQQWRSFSPAGLTLGQALWVHVCVCTHTHTHVS